MRAFVEILARSMAILGGIVLCLLVLLTCASIAGRALNTILHGSIEEIFPKFSSWLLSMGVGPINGDFELVEAGVAFAIFAFLPLCQFKSSHAVVDIFTNYFSKSANQFLLMISEILFAAVLVLITIQLFDGMLTKRQFNETTFLLQFPIWWSYALSLVAAATSAFVAIYMASIRIREFFSGTILVPGDREVDH